MSTLQKIKLGTPPRGEDGETTRAGFVKFNANVDVFDRQSALVSAPPITASQTLSADHIGRRVSINIAAGGTVKMRKASLCGADSIVWLVNVGAKRVLLAPDDGSGDSLAISGIGPGEAVALDTDGVSSWRVLMRGRASSDDESVTGKLSVGDLAVAGDASFGKRPTFAGNTPWDSGNLNPGNYATANTFQVLTARKRINAPQATGAWSDQTFVVESDLHHTGIGFRANNGAMVFRYNVDNATFECVSWDSGAFGPISASSFNVISDYRLKNVIGQIADPIERVRQFQPVMAEYKANPGNAHPMFIAHVLQKVAPHAVSGEKDALTAEGAPIHQVVDYSKITPDLAAAIIALADELDALKHRLAILEEPART
ncbi:hypothetical protein KTE57_17520 [Burkholderia multivorans]|uniref:hypothetical protein n=1 Tax=Burkholderia multivorans TaxID=87883 RepID=UPI001C210F89|nr:hypothetical protein [Burkholderia multivorans]MBU9461372.1 hypothetical protein [Burkholderia multivorans]